MSEESASGTVGVRPTIFIGVGGTGKEVLLRLRRILYEKYRAPGLPITSYLWVDTDISSAGLKKDRDVIDTKIQFLETEKLSLAVSESQMAHYYMDKPNYPQLFDWYPEQLEQLPQGTRILTDGAGQIRSAGRLSLWRKRHEFEEKIKYMHENITSAATKARTREMGFAVEDKVSETEVVIVTSLAGGTGSGTFIDAAFATRKALKKSARLIGVLFMPSAFKGIVGTGLDELYANGYASLMELDYYMTDQGRNKDSTLREKILEWPVSMGPLAMPFDTTYLVERKNEAGITYEDPYQPFAMAAEALALEFDRSDFAAAKRSYRSNMQQFMQQRYPLRPTVKVQSPETGEQQDEVIDCMYFPAIYASFGVSGAYVDQDRMRNSAAYRFSEMMCDFMLGCFEPFSGMEKKFQETLHTIGLTEKGFVGNLTGDLNKTSYLASFWSQKVDEAWGELEKTVNQRLRDDADAERMFDLLRDLDALADEVKRKGLDRYHAFIKEARTLLNREGPERGYGDHWKQIKSNVRPFREALKERLEAEILDCLCDPVNLGIPMAEKMITTAENTLKNLSDSLDKKPELIGTETLKAARLKKPHDVLDAQARYNSARSIPAFLWPYRQTAENTTRHEFESIVVGFFGRVKREFAQLLEQTKAALLNDLYVLYRDAALEAAVNTRLLQELVGYVGEAPREKTAPDGTKHTVATGLFAKVSSYRETLTALRTAFHSFFTATRKARNDERNLFFEQKLDFDGLVLAHVSAKWDLDADNRRPLMKRAMRQFFAKTQWLSQAARKRVEESQFEDDIPEVLREGMEAIYTRAANASLDSGSWAAVRKEMDDFTFLMFDGFMAGETAARALGQTGESAKKEAVVRLISRSKPWVELSTEHRDIKENYIRRMKAATAGDDAGMRELIINHSGGGYVPGEILSHQLGSLIFYSEVVAVPILAFSALAEYRDAYQRDLARDPVFNRLKRHSDKAWAKFRSILPPVGEVWAMRWQVLREISKGVALGSISYLPGSGFFYTRTTGVEDEPIRLGMSVDEIVERLSDPGESRKLAEITVKNRNELEAVQARGDSSFFQLMNLVSAYLRDIYPRGEEADGSSNMRRKAMLEWQDELLKGPTRNFVPINPGEPENEYGRRLMKDYVQVLRPTHAAIGYQDFDAHAELRSLSSSVSNSGF